jgi:hypothetical protein
MVSRVVKFFMPIEDAPMRGFNIHGDEVRFMNWSSTSQLNKETNFGWGITTSLALQRIASLS